MGEHNPIPDIVSEIYRDDQGHLRHTNCLGRACRVQNCRETVVIDQIPGEINFPEGFRFQRIVEMPQDDKQIHWIMCFEVDFNMPDPIIVIDPGPDNFDFPSESDLPAVGNKVFLYCAETQTRPGGPTDSGFGMMATVTQVHKGVGGKGYVVHTDAYEQRWGKPRAKNCGGQEKHGGV